MAGVDRGWIHAASANKTGAAGRSVMNRTLHDAQMRPANTGTNVIELVRCLHR